MRTSGRSIWASISGSDARMRGGGPNGPVDSGRNPAHTGADRLTTAADAGEADAPAQALAAPDADAPAAAVDPAAAAVDHRAECGSRADAPGKPAARAGRRATRTSARRSKSRWRAPAARPTRATTEQPEQRRGRRRQRSCAARATTAATTRITPDYGGSGGSDGDWGGGQQLATTMISCPSRSPSSTLRDHLLGQLALLNLPLRDRQIVTALIDALDDDGYLTSSLEEIAETVPRGARDRARRSCRSRLKYVQSFEPAGVGARDCAECLTLQLKALPADTPRLRRGAQGRRRDTCRCSPIATSPSSSALLHTDDAGVREVRDLIRSLNPQAGRGVLAGRSELRRSRRDRAQGRGTSGSRRSTRPRCPSCG